MARCVILLKEDAKDREITFLKHEDNFPVELGF